MMTPFLELNGLLPILPSFVLFTLVQTGPILCIQWISFSNWLLCLVQNMKVGDMGRGKISERKSFPFPRSWKKCIIHLFFAIILEKRQFALELRCGLILAVQYENHHHTLKSKAHYDSPLCKDEKCSYCPIDLFKHREVCLFRSTTKI